ncbi:hypothetical protein FRB99_003053 [Tulasnella sp. 403]|nr:hypothetical protein FRB99_003053 [Tulasnella sp. 403]
MRFASLTAPFILALVATPVLGAPANHRSNYKTFEKKMDWHRASSVDVVHPIEARGILSSFSELVKPLTTLAKDVGVAFKGKAAAEGVTVVEGGFAKGMKALGTGTVPALKAMPKAIWTFAKTKTGMATIGALALGGYMLLKKPENGNGDPNCPAKGGNDAWPAVDDGTMAQIQNMTATGISKFDVYQLTCFTQFTVNQYNIVVQEIAAGKTIAPEDGGALTQNDEQQIAAQMCGDRANAQTIATMVLSFPGLSSDEKTFVNQAASGQYCQ